jgi:hypothetical protein
VCSLAQSWQAKEHQLIFDEQFDRERQATETEILQSLAATEKPAEQAPQQDDASAPGAAPFSE